MEGNFVIPAARMCQGCLRGGKVDKPAEGSRQDESLCEGEIPVVDFVAASAYRVCPLCLRARDEVRKVSSRTSSVEQAELQKPSG